MKATRVFYDGRVQGVGFRWTTRQVAQGYDVTGTVRNLTDGRVELVVSGDVDQVHDFLQEIREDALASHIASEQREEISVASPFKGFSIVS